MDTRLLDWLLEADNPGVRARALTRLCGLSADHPRVREARNLVLDTLDAARDLSWMERKGLLLLYNLTALAESGLTRGDLNIDLVVDRLLDGPYDANCGDMMLLRALAMLGYGADPRVRERLARAAETQLPDGGWMCLHRLNKMKRVPKSCMKAAMHGLTMATEMQKRGQAFAGRDELLEYFFKRRIFYRTDDPTRFVLHSRPGGRMVDAFFPGELSRIGLPVLLDAFTALGVGREPALREAWDLLDQKQDTLGRIRLEGTMAKPYLPRERVGKPGKWVTLYAWLAYQGRDMGQRD